MATSKNEKNNLENSLENKNNLEIEKDKQKYKQILLFSFVLVGILSILGIALGFAYNNPRTQFGPQANLNQTKDELPNETFSKVSEVRKFSSCDILQKELEKNNRDNVNIPEFFSQESALNMNADSATKALPGGRGSSYSGTNNQVEGVDEGDKIKFNGNYLFNLQNQSGKLDVLKIDPNNGSMNKVSTVNTELGYGSKLSLHNNYLVAVGNVYQNFFPQEGFESGERKEIQTTFPAYSNENAVVKIYDISNPEKLNLTKQFLVSGSVLDSRLTNEGYFYLVNNQYHYNYEKNDFQKSLPQMYEGDSRENKYQCDDIETIYPIKSRNFINILALNLNNSDLSYGKKSILGAGQNLYTSPQNLYLANSVYRKQQENTLSSQNTEIYKFTLDGTNINYKAINTVKGTVLNQFSMDEFEGNLRIATNIVELPNYTPNPIPFFGEILPIRPTQNESKVTNSVYILDTNLEQIGALENLAKDERIYAVRFSGKTGYMVTFKNIDPLFTFDLSDPRNPKVLGELKIPGFSNYLHPISDTKIIGVGKDVSVLDVAGAERSNVEGLKIGLFDISDMNNPKEISNVVLGDPGSYSEVLNDHKAFLWDERNQLLTLPVNLYISKNDSNSNNFQNPSDQSFNGVYIYNVSENGFNFKGRVSHFDTYKEIQSKQPERKFDEFGQLVSSGVQNLDTNICDPEGKCSSQTRSSMPYYSEYNYNITRSVYFNNTLITISENLIQTNNISTLERIDFEGI